MAAIVEQKRKPFCKNVGGTKIALMSGSGVSGPTANKILRVSGFDPVVKRKGKHIRRFSKACPMDRVGIDFVEVGVDSDTGLKVESLTVEDDHSRYYLGAFVTTSPTTDFVIECLDEVFSEHGVPRTVHSDHGSQWYAVNGGDSRFDAKCEEWGTEHTMAPIRTPECNGKVERIHGSMRTEIDFPEKAPLKVYQQLLESYVRYYNEQRPHCALDYRTPKEVFEKTRILESSVPDIVRMILMAYQEHEEARC